MREMNGIQKGAHRIYKPDDEFYKLHIIATKAAEATPIASTSPPLVDLPVDLRPNRMLLNLEKN